MISREAWYREAGELEIERLLADAMRGNPEVGLPLTRVLERIPAQKALEYLYHSLQNSLSYEQLMQLWNIVPDPSLHAPNPEEDRVEEALYERDKLLDYIGWMYNFTEAPDFRDTMRNRLVPRYVKWFSEGYPVLKERSE